MSDPISLTNQGITDRQADPFQDDFQDPISAIKKKAARNLEMIGLIGTEHIIKAFKDRDGFDRLTTVVEFKTTYWNPAAQEMIWSRSNFVSLASEITLVNGGGFITLILQFKEPNHRDLNGMWCVLEDYGRDIEKISSDNLGIPVIGISVVPMSLGGNYGMIATDPIFWHLQPEHPYDEACNQIRILFQPESVIFLRDESFESDEVIAKIKSEFAAKKLSEEARIQKQIQDQEFKRKHEAEIAEYLDKSKYVKHTFRTDRK